ncbi:MAG: NAD(P)H-hydrate dehydratase [Clostridia bacterium]|nr:NAD(P)H-hydrate dehydratase [Clostridia bacterium]
MKILTVEQIKAAEQDAVASGVLSFYDLMERAADKAAQYLLENVVGEGTEVFIVCGNGNNGGDGLVLADKLKNAGCAVSVFFPFGKPETSPAKDYLNLCDDLWIVEDIPEKSDVIIDALFGIGLNRPLVDYAARVIERMNACKAKKIALDIPSGCFADGRGESPAFMAELTLTFIALKPCFFLPPFNENCGKIEVLDIGVAVSEHAYLTIDRPENRPRPKNSHKGTFGTVLTLTGSYGMCGASVLSAKAALVSGVGMVKSFVPDKNYAAFTSSIPEAVVIPTETFSSGAMAVYGSQIQNEMASADSILIGCGIGSSNEAKNLVKAILEIANKPMVLDADGINAVAGNIELLRKTKTSVILTPHPGEMARLCQVPIGQIEQNRPGFAKRIAVTYGKIVVLKGANTIVAAPDGKVFFNRTGNPGLATGGSGDVLAGIIAARLALGESPVEAAKNGVWIHGFAADNALSKYSMSGLTPSDIITELKTL